MPQNSRDERRQAFRISDKALVEIVPLDPQTAPDQFASKLPRSDGFLLLSELQQIEQQLQHQLFKLTDSSPTLASALQLLNKKIERLALHASDSPTQNEPQPITLSTGGLSLLRAEQIPPQTYCAVRLRLLPGGFVIQTLAQVIYSQQQDADNVRIGLAFINPDEAGQDLIAGHILQQQALNRRLEREQQLEQSPTTDNTRRP
ncbi:MAG: PilZ domain-containing protein [Motiliproteus sp.]